MVRKCLFVCFLLFLFLAPYVIASCVNFTTIIALDDPSIITVTADSNSWVTPCGPVGGGGTGDDPGQT